MKQKTIGNYLGRPITLSMISDLGGVKESGLSGLLILLWLYDPLWEPAALQSAVNHLSSECVVGISVAGERVDESFSILLDNLSRRSMKPHIITGMFKEQEMVSVVEAFLFSTLPSEERFDEWRGYRIIVLGDSRKVNSVHGTLKDILHQ